MQLLTNRMEVEGGCDPRSPVVAPACRVLTRLLTQLDPSPNAAVLDAVLRCCDAVLNTRLPAPRDGTAAPDSVSATLTSVRHLRQVAASVLASSPANTTSPARLPRYSSSDVASPARRSRRSLSLQSAASAAAAARAALPQDVPPMDVPHDVFAWRWGGHAVLANVLPPPARSLRWAPGCSLALSPWLLFHGDGMPRGSTEGGVSTSRGASGHAGVADAVTAARHVAQIEADRARRRTQTPQQHDMYGSTADGTEAMYGGASATMTAVPGGYAASGATTEAMWPHSNAGGAGSSAGNSMLYARPHGGTRFGGPVAAVASSYRSRAAAMSVTQADAKSGGVFPCEQLPQNGGARTPLQLRVSHADLGAVVQIVSAGQPPVSQTWLSNSTGQHTPLMRSPSGNLGALARFTAHAATHPSAGSGGGGNVHAACADVAGGVLVRLMWDQFLQSGPQLAAAAVTPLLRGMLGRPTPRARCAAFDVLLTCAVHVPWTAGQHTTTPAVNDDDTDADEISRRLRHANRAAAEGHAWLRTLCSDCLLALAASGERHSAVWHSAVALLLTLCTQNGRLVLPHMTAACPLPAMRALVDASAAHGWDPELRGALLRAAAAMLYEYDATPVPQVQVSSPPKLVPAHVTSIGGTAWLIRALATAPPCRVTRGALMAPLLDLALLRATDAAVVQPGAQDVTQLLSGDLPTAPSPRNRSSTHIAAAPAGGSHTNVHFSSGGDNALSGSSPQGLDVLLAAALHLSGGADALAVAALGHSGVAAALADGLCACWPVETCPGGCLEALGPHNAVPPVLASLETMCVSATALPPQLNAAAAASASVGDADGSAWPSLIDMLRSPHSNERRDATAWLILALRDSAMAAAASPHKSDSGAALSDAGRQAEDPMGGVTAQREVSQRAANGSAADQHEGGDSSDSDNDGEDKVDALRRGRSVLPDPDTPLGMLLNDCVTPEPPPGGPSLLRALVERALLHTVLSCQPFPSGAGGQATLGMWALATLEDAALRLASHGGQAGAVEATEMLISALAAFPDDTSDDFLGMAGGGSAWTHSQQQRSPPAGGVSDPGRGTATWHSLSSRLLSGGCTIPMALLRHVRLDTLLALFTALSPLAPPDSSPAPGEQQQPGPSSAGGSFNASAHRRASGAAWLGGGCGAHPVGVASRPRSSCASDARAVVVLLLLARCAVSEPDFEVLGGEGTVRSLTEDTDARVAYAAACFLLARLARAAPGAYRAGLRRLVLHAQDADDERLLDNPHFRYMALSMY